MKNTKKNQTCIICKTERPAKEMGCMAFKDMVTHQIIDFTYCQKKEPANECRKEAHRKFNFEYSEMIYNYHMKRKKHD